MYGIIKAVGTGKPRNHAVEIDNMITIVPCGNIKYTDERDNVLL
jgi:hypothetical protein